MMVAVVLLLRPDIGQTALVLASWAVLLFLSGISLWMVLGVVCSSAPTVTFRILPGTSMRFSIGRHPATPIRWTALWTPLLRAAGLGEVRMSHWPSRESLTPCLLCFRSRSRGVGVIFCLLLVGLIGFIALRVLIVAQSQSNFLTRLAATIVSVQFAMQSGIHLALPDRYRPGDFTPLDLLALCPAA